MGKLTSSRVTAGVSPTQRVQADSSQPSNEHEHVTVHDLNANMIHSRTDQSFP